VAVPYRSDSERKRRARLRYATDDKTREAALERSRKQRERLKVDDAYRARRNEWIRRYRRKRRESVAGPSS
jgi:hypothetical protein